MRSLRCELKIRACNEFSVSDHIFNQPKTSDHTDIRGRIVPSFYLLKVTDVKIKQNRLQRFDLHLKLLAQFENNAISREKISVLFSLKHYQKLGYMTGRMIRPDKRGAIPINLLTITNQ